MKFYIDLKRYSSFYKALLIMKLVILFMVMSFLHVSATGLAQNITLRASNASLEKVLKEISKQSSYDLAFSSDMLKESKPVDINLVNVPFKQALEECFQGQQLTYSLVKNTVVVKWKEEKNVIPNE